MKSIKTVVASMALMTGVACGNAQAILLTAGDSLRADWSFSADPLTPPYTNAVFSFNLGPVEAGTRLRWSLFDLTDHLLVQQSLVFPVTGYFNTSSGTPFIGGSSSATQGYLLLEGLTGTADIVDGGGSLSPPRLTLSRFTNGTFVSTAQQALTFSPLPEPSTSLLLIAGALLGGLFSRRHRLGERALTSPRAAR